MTTPQLHARCPACGTLALTRALAIVDGKVEILCAACGTATRYPPFVAEPGLGGLPAALAPVAMGTAVASPVSLAPAVAAQSPTTPIPAAVAPAVDRGPLLAVAERIRGLAPALAQRYVAIVEDGDELEHHADLLKLAALQDQLTPIGALYRARGEVAPGDAVAAAMRERVVTMALATMVRSEPTVEEPRSRRLKLTLAALFLALCVAFAVSMVARSEACGLLLGGGAEIGAMPAERVEQD